jgi:integrase
MALFCAELRDFAAWAKLRKLSALTASELDRHGAEYLDHLFFGGYQAERGEKLLAALQALHPELGTAATGSLPLMRAGMRGFRKLAHGYSRTPLVLEAVHAIIGQLAATQRLDMARAILVSWDAFLRLPSDLVRMTGASWVAPVAGLAGNRWGLLLYPEEQDTRSKTTQFDESVMLDHPVIRSLGNIWKQKIAAAGATGAFWDFSDVKFTRAFSDTILQLGLPPTTVAYQLRHGAASYAALQGTRSLAEIQRRLRHASPVSTQRYEKHTRYLAEVGKLTPELRGYAAWVDSRLRGLLLGTTSAITFREFCSANHLVHNRALSTSSGPPAKRQRTVGKLSSS